MKYIKTLLLLFLFVYLFSEDSVMKITVENDFLILGDEYYTNGIEVGILQENSEPFLFNMEKNFVSTNFRHTDGQDKAPTLQNLGASLHYDDDEVELEAAKKLGIKVIDAGGPEADAANLKWMQDEYGIGLPDAE